MFSDQNKNDLINILKVHFSLLDTDTITNINRIPLGSDAQIYSFEITIDSKRHKFLLKLFRNRLPEERSENEYINHCQIYKSDIKVPKPFGFLKNTCSFKRPFMIMEFTDGERLSKRISKNILYANPLIIKFVENLVRIHSSKWQSYFDNLYEPDIKKDPLIIVKSMLNRTKKIVQEKEIFEFYPILDWLESNMKSNYCEELVLCHGDYHPDNIIITNNNELITLDWSNVGLSDRRVDLAFTLVLLKSELRLEIETIVILLYENQTNVIIGDLSYFKVLCHLFNFLRMYSSGKDFSITQETEETKNSLLHEYRNYCLEVLKIMKETIKANFPVIEDFLSN